jgi:hypothetical protein
MNRLAIAREDPVIRASIPASTFRSQAQAKQETHMKMLLAAKQAQMRKAAAEGTGAGAGAGRGDYNTMAAANRNGKAQQQQSGYPQTGSGPPPPPSRPLHGPPRKAAVPRSPSSPPPLPFVYRRAGFDIQITDPATNDILVLDKGTWVLSAAGPHPVTNLLPVYTTEHETGKVLVYELPIPEGNMAKYFDMHTLNVVETMALDQEYAEETHESAAAAAAGAVNAWPTSYEHNDGTA